MLKVIFQNMILLDGYYQGYNIELVEGKKIVQAGHFA
jgi:hypothetical protein